MKPTLAAKEHHFPASPALYRLRSYFVYVIIGGLISSALVAIIAILIGDISNIIGRSIGSVTSIIFHSLVALAFISVTTRRQPNTGSTVIIQTLFAITLLSLLLSLTSIWGLITDIEFITRQYTVFIAAILASVLIYGLFQSNEQDKSTIIARNTAIGSVTAGFTLLLPVLYDVDNLPDFYYRLLAATSIIVATSVVITIILHGYYMSKHPELRESTPGNQSVSLGTTVLRVAGIIVIVWIALGILSSISQFFY